MHASDLMSCTSKSSSEQANTHKNACKHTPTTPPPCLCVSCHHLQNYDADDAFDGGDLPADGIDVLQEEQPQAPAGDRPRITTRYMTKYERARVLGTRALQIR